MLVLSDDKVYYLYMQMIYFVRGQLLCQDMWATGGLLATVGTLLYRSVFEHGVAWILFLGTTGEHSAPMTQRDMVPQSRRYTLGPISQVSMIRIL